jgi:hypothetical protein
LVGGDLVPVAGADVEPEREADLAREKMDAVYVALPDNIAAHLTPRASLLERNASDLPRAVIFHDPAGERLVPFLAEHFSRTLVDVSDKLPVALIEQEKPLVAIQIFAEEDAFLT